MAHLTDNQVVLIVVGGVLAAVLIIMALVLILIKLHGWYEGFTQRQEDLRQKVNCLNISTMSGNRFYVYNDFREIWVDISGTSYTIYPKGSKFQIKMGKGNYPNR
jgi:hypothetical protein